MTDAQRAALNFMADGDAGRRSMAEILGAGHGRAMRALIAGGYVRRVFNRKGDDVRFFLTADGAAEAASS